MTFDLEAIQDDVRINLTPVSDVVFLLIIFFLVATTFVREEKEIDVDLPETPSAAPLESLPEELVINVMRDGRILVAGRAISVEALAGLLEQAKGRNPRQTALIRGDRGVRYEHVVRVVGVCHAAAVSTSLAALEEPEPGGG